MIHVSKIGPQAWAYKRTWYEGWGGGPIDIDQVGNEL